MVQAKEEKWGKKGLALSLAAFLKCAEVLQMAKEPQIIGRMLGNIRDPMPMSASNVK